MGGARREQPSPPATSHWLRAAAQQPIRKVSWGRQGGAAMCRVGLMGLGTPLPQGRGEQAGGDTDAVPMGALRPCLPARSSEDLSKYSWGYVHPWLTTPVVSHKNCKSLHI